MTAEVLPSKAQESPRLSVPQSGTAFPVRSGADWEAFLSLPWEVYRGDPLWVPPIVADVREILSPPNPFWRHAERELFLVRKGSRIVGRCAAILDRLYNECQNDACGFFGFFECLQDAEAARALLDAARGWLASKGMRRMRGPASPSMNDECGLLVKGFNDPPAVMMPYNPSYYTELLEGAALSKAKDLYSYFINSAWPFPKRLSRLSELIERREGVRIRPLEMGRWDRELQTIRDIYNQAWEKNWGFAPMTPAELDYMAGKLKPILHPDAVHFAEVRGVVAAFSILLPDVNQALRHLDGKLGLWGTLKFLFYSRRITRTRLVTLGIRKEYRNRGLDVLLYREAWRTAFRKGWTGELGWILEDNELMNRGMQALEAEQHKTYRIYETAL